MKIKTNGLDFNCRIDGREGAPWVVLGHGLATDHSMWDELAAALAPHYRVLRYDVRGHGGTAATPGEYTLPMLVNDVIGLMDALQIDKAHYCGLSMGGMVGEGLALDHPHRIKSSSVCDAPHTATPAFSKAWHDRIAQVRQGGIAAIVEPTATRWSSAGLAERRPDLLDRMRRMIRATSADGYCGCAAALAGLAYGPRLSQAKIPMQFITGDQDHGAPPENARQMHAMVPGSRVLEIRNAGHISNIEQPDIFNAAILSLIDEVEATATTKETRP
jgi:3-oxoadipate enol-lactonase